MGKIGSANDAFDFNIKGKDKDGKFDLVLECHSYANGKVTGKAKRCEYSYTTTTSGQSRLDVKVYDTSGVTDCDGWTLRTFDLRMDGVVIAFIENGWISGSAYVTSLSYFTDEDYPHDEVAEEGYVESCFPTDRFKSDAGLAVKVSFSIRPHKGG